MPERMQRAGGGVSAQPRTGSIDFDGVLNSYKGWRGATEIDAPVEGAVEFMTMLQDAGFQAVVSSTRALTYSGMSAIRHWMQDQGFPDVPVTGEKVPALFSLDDRAMRFEGPGHWPTRDEIEAACVPWNRR